MAIGQFQQEMCLWGVNQDSKDSKELPLYVSGTNQDLEKWVPKGSTPALMERTLPYNTFYPHSSQGTNAWLLHSPLRVKPWKENREDTQYTCKSLGDLWYLLKATDKYHSDEHAEN